MDDGAAMGFPELTLGKCQQVKQILTAEGRTVVLLDPGSMSRNGTPGNRFRRFSAPLLAASGNILLASLKSHAAASAAQDHVEERQALRDRHGRNQPTFPVRFTQECAGTQ